VASTEKIHNLLTYSTLNNTPQCLRKVRLSPVGRVIEFSNAAEILPTVGLEKRQGTESNDAYTCAIIHTLKHYIIWKA